MEAGPRNRAQQPDRNASETAPLTQDGPDTPEQGTGGQ